MKKLLLISLAVLLFSCEKEDDLPKFKVIKYQDWDMSSEFSRTIKNPIDASRIISYRCIIYPDVPKSIRESFKIDSFNLALGKPNGSIVFNGDSILIMIEELGIFNSTRFDSIPHGRGLLTLKYE